jgi:GDP-4-dehydro-6-deoxy-D-mannose reductase
MINVMEGVRAAGHKPRILVVSSAEAYGRAFNGRPLDEQAPLCPESPYAVSKAAVDLLGYQYYAAYGLDVVRVRPFPHIGPGQSDRFVTASFAHQIAQIERGERDETIEVGNLEAKRDFTDVRDMVAAYELALLNGEPGAVYNIGSGAAVSIAALLEQLIASSHARVTVRVDSSRLRPADAPVLVCDPTRFRERTHWEVRIPLQQTLEDILSYWRRHAFAA